MPLYDFHTHTFFSDGELLPTELIRRAIVKGYTAMAITDHASASNISHLVESVRRDSDLVKAEWGFTVLVGVELTHCPPKSIAKLAAKAKSEGADMVVIHGETLVEPVPPGTNRASVECPDVDILAHPGLLKLEEAEIAARTGVYLEITSRRGHCLGNGNTANMARITGAKLIIDSDTHSPGDLHTEEFVRSVGLGAGLTEDELKLASVTNPEEILKRVGKS
jgi:histidinol phosphatase-like PHP family hydrolase